jgi:hypothetical protein
MTAARPLPKPPFEIRDLVEALGVDGALHLIEQRGGTRVNVPDSVNQGHALALLVGLEGAKRLAEIHGGTQLRVPLSRAWRILVYHARGESYATIARKLGVVDSTIYRHLERAGKTASQPDLFG